jgi:hypothetical protein
MIFEFLMMIGHADIEELKFYSLWKDKIIDFLCEEESKACREEWQ